jgi:hypothetical protein
VQSVSKLVVAWLLYNLCLALHKPRKGLRSSPALLGHVCLINRCL